MPDSTSKQNPKATGPEGTKPQGTVSSPGPLQSDANPTGQPEVSTGDQSAPFEKGAEHVLGDDPRRTANRSSGYHDSLTGRPVTQSGEFVEVGMEGQGPVPQHRIVADNWPQEREKIDDPTTRKGNTASTQ